jgi:hypothetical protein
MMVTSSVLHQSNFTEVWGLMSKKFRSIAVILFAFSAFLCLAAAGDSFMPGSGGLTNDSIDAANITGLKEADSGQGGAATASYAQGIWRAALGEEVVIMAVNQSGQFLFGQSKYEGALPWNAALAGSISHSEISVSLAAIEGDAVVSTFIRADLQGESMNGSFVRSESNGKAGRGEFSATLISPDTSGYTPAEVAALPLQKDQADELASALTNETELSAEEEPAATYGESKFRDVTKLANAINPDILPRMAPL